MSRIRLSFHLIAICSVALVLAIAAKIARAVEDLELDIESISGADWQASGLRARIDLSARGERAQLWIDTLRVLGLKGPLRDVHVDCPSVDISTAEIGCKNASVVAQVPTLGAQQLRADVVYGRADDSIQFSIQNIRIGAGRLALNGSLRDDGWRIAAQARKVALETLAGLASGFDIALPIAITDGTIDVDARASGSGAQVAAVTATGSLHDLTANSEDGAIASEKLTLGLEARLEGLDDGWRYDVRVDARAGQAYFEPIFLDFGVRSLVASARGNLRGESALTVEEFSIDHTDVLAASGSAVVDFEQERALRELRLAMTKLEFPGAYESYMQPMLLGTSFEAMSTSGTIAGEIGIDDGMPVSADISLTAVSFEGGDISIQDLAGRILWQDAPENAASRVTGPQSELRWTKGALYGLELGQSAIKLAAQGRNVRLLEPTRIPFLDGALRLDSLRVRNAGMPSVAFMIDATLEPVSVQRLCHTFGWPEFGGTLGGTISKLRMRDGVISLGTTLEARVFDGLVKVSDLRLEEPFGTWPRFYSSIQLDNLDLELVTSAFSFGRITGRMSGAILGLQLFNWSPVAFDARLFTPPDDRSRHRISQRAVQNIGSIGGGGAGVTAALSSGVMRFFDDFNYARLGISCKLHNEVCEMNGVTPAPNGGYYLVQGRGLPRIDVIGNSRRVDWPRLVQQLIAVTQSEGPVVE